MTPARRLILALALLGLVFMVLAPPVRLIRGEVRTTHVEYRWFWDMDRTDYYRQTNQLELPRLALQLVALAGVTAATWLLARPR